MTRCGWCVVRKYDYMVCGIFFFFKQKTAYEIKECDWSSDVCSSDLERTFVDTLVQGDAGLVCLACNETPRQEA